MLTRRGRRSGETHEICLELSVRCRPPWVSSFLRRSFSAAEDSPWKVGRTVESEKSFFSSSKETDGEGASACEIFCWDGMVDAAR